MTTYLAQATIQEYLNHPAVCGVIKHDVNIYCLVNAYTKEKALKKAIDYFIHYLGHNIDTTAIEILPTI